MTNPIPTPGRIVAYCLTAQDCETIKAMRDQSGLAQVNQVKQDGTPNGARSLMTRKHGNLPAPGDTYPMMITRVWGTTETSSVNGQVFLDGNDTHWVTSVSALPEGMAPEPGKFCWPARG